MLAAPVLWYSVMLAAPVLQSVMLAAPVVWCSVMLAAPVRQSVMLAAPVRGAEWDANTPFVVVQRRGWRSRPSGSPWRTI